MNDINKTVINNWTGGGTLQTWTDGEWQILYAKDSAGNCVTLSLTSHDAVRLAYAVSPIPNERHERMRAANAAVYELSYPEAKADELRQIADEIECDGGCEGCGPQKLERGEFCGFVSADGLRKLATALDLKAKIDAESRCPSASAEAVLLMETLSGIRALVGQVKPDDSKDDDLLYLLLEIEKRARQALSLQADTSPPVSEVDAEEIARALKKHGFTSGDGTVLHCGTFDAINCILSLLKGGRHV